MPLLVEDRELLDGYRRGRPDALTRVFRHYAPGVAALLRAGFNFESAGQRIRFSGHTQTFDLEDAVQEVFQRAFGESARRAYDGLRPFRAYLGAITRNTVINQWQARQRTLERFRALPPEDARTGDWSLAHDPLEGGGAPTGCPDEDHEAAELRRLLATFIAGLKERERLVFDLRFVENRTHEEIARETGISAARIKTSEARIRRRLLRFLRGHGYLSATEAKPLAAVALATAPGDEP